MLPPTPVSRERGGRGWVWVGGNPPPLPPKPQTSYRFGREWSGFHTTAREPKRAHLRVLAFRNTTKIQREDPQRETKSENGGGRGEKKREILGPAPFGPPPDRGCKGEEMKKKI